MGTKQYDSATDLITLTRASSATFLGSNGLIQTVTNNAPRIEYNADGTVKGLLIEEARTNLVANSNDLTNAEWSKTRSSITANAGVSPDGTSNANKLVIDTTSGVHYTYLTEDLHTVSGDHTFSVYVAAAGYGFATICAGVGGTSDYYAVVIDLSDGTKTATYTAGTHTDKTCTVEDVGGSYYRVSISGDGEKYYVVGGVDTGTYTPANYGYKIFNGDGTSGILVYGGQVEAGSFPTSYIPTSGATATRARDLASILVTDFGYNNDAGSLVFDVETPLTDQLMILAWFNTSSYLNARGFAKSTYSGSGVGNWFNNSAYDGSSTRLNLPIVGAGSESTKLGLSYKDNEAGVRDGGTVVSGTRRYPNPTTLHFGGRENGVQSQCWIKSVKYYPRKLTDAQLQELTT